MKKTTKLVTAALILAIAVSIFAAVGAFAATDVTYGTVLYSMEKNGVNKSSNFDKYLTMSEEEVNGTAITTMSYDSTMDASAEVYWSPTGFGKSTTIIRDIDDTNKKNTDYLVLDFDIATDSELFDNFNVNNYLYSTTSGAKADRVGTSNNSRNPNFKRGANGRIYLEVNSTSKTYSTITHPDDKGNKWVNVTLIYDFHTAEDGTVTNKAYAYFDGIFAGEIACITSAAKMISTPRLTISQNPSFDEHSVSFANFTFVKFDAGYAGPLTEAGALGNSEINLADLADLKYTQENCPETPDDYDVRPVIATISRTTDGVTEKTDVRDPSELKHLVEGDVVTVRRSFTTSEPYAGIVTRGEVTWLDYKGVNIVSPEEGQTAKVTIPKLYVADAASDWVIIYDSVLQVQGTAAEITGVGNDRMQSELHASRNCHLVLLGDVITYGNGKKAPRYGYNFDLNGYTLTFLNTASYIEAQDAYSNTKITFRNGTLSYGREDDPTTPENEYYAPTANILMMQTTSDKIETVLFENMTINIIGSNMIDQRCGNVIFRNCTINAKHNITSLKASGGNPSTLTIDNCVVNMQDSHITSMRNTSVTGKRYGSFVCEISLVDSTVRGNKTILDVLAYADERGVSGATEADNTNVAKISVVNCDIETFDSKTADFLNIGINSYAEDGSMSLSVVLDIKDSRIKANNLINNEAVATEEKVAAVSLSASITDDTRLDLQNADGTEAKIYNAGDTCMADVSISVGEGVHMPSYGGPAGGGFEDVLVGESKVVIAYVDGEYVSMVSSVYEAYTYQIEGQEAVEFYWYGDEANIDINRMFGISDTDLYTYCFEKNGNAYVGSLSKDFAFSAKFNLTLYDYIHFNLYINKDQYDEAIRLGAKVDLVGGALDTAAVVTIAEVEYYKVQIKDIKVTEADEDVLSVTLSFDGAYGDTYSVTNSFSVLGYAEDMLASSNELSVKLVKALVNYIAVASDYENDAETAATAAALIKGESFGAVAGEAKLGTLSDAEIAIAYGDNLYVAIKTAAGESVTLSYTAIDGSKQSITRRAQDNGEIYIAIKAYDFATDLTLTKGAESAVVNLAGYYAALAGDAKAQAVVEAIYNYANAAAAYKATTL